LPKEKQLCKFCKSNEYTQNKLSIHLRQEHEDVEGLRNFVKNASKYLSEEKLKEVVKLIKDLNKNN